MSPARREIEDDDDGHDGHGGHGGEELEALLDVRARLLESEAKLKAHLDLLAAEVDHATGAGQRYRHFFEASERPHFVTDHLGMIREANAAACDLLAVSLGYLRGKPLAVFVDLPDRRTFRAAVHAAAQRDVHIALKMGGRSQRLATVELRCSPLRGSAQLLWFVETREPADR